MIQNWVDKLIEYGLHTGILQSADRIYATNTLLDILKIDQYADKKNVMESTWDNQYESPENTLEEILAHLLNYAFEKGLIEENTVTCRDLYDARLMNALMPRPSQVIETFWKYYQQSPKIATDYYYKLVMDSDYIRRYRICRDKKWTVDSQYGAIDITINLSKPEKDPRDIAKAKCTKQSAYPKCLLCMENEGYAGSISSPARENHRIIPMKINGEDWGLQYSPYVYYNEHCIVLNQKHIPMTINQQTFLKLFSFIEQFPHYFVGSNADLPIVGGSILSHEHFQGGNYTFAMAKAKIEKEFVVPGFEDVQVGILHWPLSVIRARSKDKLRLAAFAARVLEKWRTYSDAEASIYAKTENTQHNTITPIARKNGELYEIDLTLRNNITTKERPLGVYHPRAEYHHIKKENIGLIEVMGLAILPKRLNEEMQLLSKCMISGEDMSKYPELEKHLEWVEGWKADYDTVTKSNIDTILQAEIGKVFVKVLEDSGVFKCTPKGRHDFDKFIRTI